MALQYKANRDELTTDEFYDIMQLHTMFYRRFTNLLSRYGSLL